MQTVREPRISRATEELKVSQDQYCDLEDNQQKLEGWIPVQTLPDSNELKYAPSPKSKNWHKYVRDGQPTQCAGRYTLPL